MEVTAAAGAASMMVPDDKPTNRIGERGSGSPCGEALRRGITPRPQPPPHRRHPPSSFTTGRNPCNHSPTDAGLRPRHGGRDGGAAEHHSSAAVTGETRSRRLRRRHPVRHRAALEQAATCPQQPARSHNWRVTVAIAKLLSSPSSVARGARAARKFAADRPKKCFHRS
jgi:hypothetical protein